MNTRTTTSKIDFRRPFTINGHIGQLPAGTYKIDTMEKTVSNTIFARYQPVSIVLHLPVQLENPQSGQAVTVMPDAFKDAVKRDRKKFMPIPATVSSGYTP
ncbi:MAG: hypothetical protein RIM72_04475 [Alphaproteobacteria bacterium]